MTTVETNVPLQAHNSFGIVAKARELVRVRGEADVLALLDDPELAPRPTGERYCLNSASMEFVEEGQPLPRKTAADLARK